jgi:hypothetical protein
LHPKITSGAATVTLGTPATDSGISLLVTQPNPSEGHNGLLRLKAGSTPGFYRYSVPGTDTSAVSEQQSGWILVGPAATGDKQKAKQEARYRRRSP